MILELVNKNLSLIFVLTLSM